MSIDADVVGSEIVVAVTDSGPGITAEQGHDIFQSFVTSKSDGMGIGLAISRSIIESHGGKIRAITDTGYGKIEFSLPISEHT
jgi:signal transduction histidine kinase